MTNGEFARPTLAHPPILTRVGGGGVNLDAILGQGLEALGQQGHRVAAHLCGSQFGDYRGQA